MEVVGIFGSDVRYWLDVRSKPFILEAPMVMCHEAPGTVIKCGPDEKSLEPGDRAAIEPEVPSGLIRLYCVAATRAYGAQKILNTDVMDYRLKLAKKMGANLYAEYI
ncbi:unnamed protein product [Diabrotica balteata]|uniref:Alcohol dehydrogenase-like N-terminal domain-containing protein n=1 Tax=Diabrotica balteata TaxID=107213 RepID=A0A9N9TC25_DIABA|nr:unnamed protein product [Diabrotica balteata]